MHSSKRTIDDMMCISDGCDPHHYIKGRGMIGGMSFGNPYYNPEDSDEDKAPPILWEDKLSFDKDTNEVKNTDENEWNKNIEDPLDSLRDAILVRGKDPNAPTNVEKFNKIDKWVNNQWRDLVEFETTEFTEEDIPRYAVKDYNDEIKKKKEQLIDAKMQEYALKKEHITEEEIVNQLNNYAESHLKNPESTYKIGKPFKDFSIKEDKTKPDMLINKEYRTIKEGAFNASKELEKYVNTEIEDMVKSNEITKAKGDEIKTKLKDDIKDIYIAGDISEELLDEKSNIMEKAILEGSNLINSKDIKAYDKDFIDFLKAKAISDGHNLSDTRYYNTNSKLERYIVDNYLKYFPVDEIGKKSLAELKLNFENARDVSDNFQSYAKTKIEGFEPSEYNGQIGYNIYYKDKKNPKVVNIQMVSPNLDTGDVVFKKTLQPYEKGRSYLTIFNNHGQINTFNNINPQLIEFIDLWKDKKEIQKYKDLGLIKSNKVVKDYRNKVNNSQLTPESKIMFLEDLDELKQNEKGYYKGRLKINKAGNKYEIPTNVLIPFRSESFKPTKGKIGFDKKINKLIENKKKEIQNKINQLK